MAKLKSSTSIKTSGSSLDQRDIFWFNTTAGSPTYIHMKTNIPNASNWMFYIEAEGYNYGTGSSILCSWGGYTYSGSNSIIQQSLKNYYSGMSADGMYISSDNYAVIRASSSGLYYCGFILNAIMTSWNGYGQTISVQAVSQNSNSGNYY